MQVSNVSNESALVVGNTKVESFTMGQSKEFFSILTDNLYSKPLLAVVRETMCNAWDAHLDAGKQDTPISVTVTEKELIVKDYGKGIPHEKMHEIYAVFGSSTKVLQSNQTGGFGLGCKAPFAITDTFTVVNTHKGKTGIYTCIKSDPENKGLPSIRTVLFTSAKEGESGGLTVTIPLHKDDVEKVKKYVNQVSALGGILLEGVPPTQRIIDNDIFYVLDEKYNYVYEKAYPKVYCGYGNVVYKIDTTYFPKLAQLQFPYDFNPCILKLPANSLTVAPSRESLVYDEKTISSLTKTINKWYGYVNNHWKTDTLNVIAKAEVPITEYCCLLRDYPYTSGTIRTINEKSKALATEKYLMALGYLMGRQLPRRYLNLWLPSSITKILNTFILNRKRQGVTSASWIQFQIKKLFKKDYTKLYSYFASYYHPCEYTRCYSFLKLSPKFEHCKKARNLSKLQTYIKAITHNTIVLTNNISCIKGAQLLPTTGCFVISCNLRNEQLLKEKTKHYASLGFKVFVLNTRTSSSDLKEIVKRSNNKQLKEREFLGGKGKLALPATEVHCYSMHSDMVRTVNVAPFRDLLYKLLNIKEDEIKLDAEVFKDVNCLKVKDSSDKKFAVRNKIPTFSNYVFDTWYKEKITAEKESRFKKVFDFVFDNILYAKTVFVNLAHTKCPYNSVLDLYLVSKRRRSISSLVQETVAFLFEQIKPWECEDQLLFIMWLHVIFTSNSVTVSSEYVEFCNKLTNVAQNGCAHKLASNLLNLRLNYSLYPGVVRAILREGD